MASGNWHLNVIQIDKTIDDTTVKMLAYEVKEKKAVSEESVLELSNVDEYSYKLFQEVLLGFFHPHNALFGKKIWENRYAAIYERSKSKYPSSLPVTSEYGTSGLIYCGYQLMGTHPFGCVLCLHNYKKEDRERSALYTFQVIDVVASIAYQTNAIGAMFLLEKMRRYWNSYPTRKIDIHTWSYVVDTLIEVVAADRTVATKFRKKYPNILCLYPVRTIHDRNQRSQARSWLSEQFDKYILAKGTFEKLGYASLEQVCAAHNGFVRDDEVTEPKDKQYFKILKDVVQKIYENFFLQDKWPEYKLITNERAVYNGMAVVYKRKERKLNLSGLYIRYDIGALYLKTTLLAKDRYHSALSTFIHELCHMFGGEASASFAQGLTYAMEILLEHTEEIEAGKKQWESVS